jgi:STAS-like domain of unknown function (DUF4325)
MTIHNNSQQTTQAVFAKFTDPEEYTFRNTVFFVSLAAFEAELTSRSQAKLIASRFEKFEEVELDFAGVASVGQAFADELVRVWPLAHPKVFVKVAGATESVRHMLKHVLGRSDLPQATNFSFA